MFDFKIEIGNVPIRITCRHKYLFEQCKDYLTENAEVFSVIAFDSDIKKEAEITQKTNGFTPDECYLESTAIYRKICEKIIEFDGFLIHSSVIKTGNSAICFLGQSGAGKTTQSNYWVRDLGAYYINGDKPIVRYINGEFVAFGTPWCGKEQFNSNTFAPIRAFVNVNKAQYNKIEKLPMEKSFPVCFCRIYCPENESLVKIMNLLEKMLSKVPTFNLFCKKEPQSAMMTYEKIKEYYEGVL